MSEKFVDLGSKKWIHKTLAYLSSPETPTENSSVHRTQWISQRKLNILCVSACYWCKIEYYVYIIQGTRSITINLAIYLMRKYSLDRKFNTEVKESKLKGEYFMRLSRLKRRSDGQSNLLWIIFYFSLFWNKFWRLGKLLEKMIWHVFLIYNMSESSIVFILIFRSSILVHFYKKLNF